MKIPLDNPVMGALQSPAGMELQVTQIPYHWGIVGELVLSVSKSYLKRTINLVKRN